MTPSTEVGPQPQQWHHAFTGMVLVDSSGKASQPETYHSATEQKTLANLALHFFNISYYILQVTHFLGIFFQ